MLQSEERAQFKIESGYPNENFDYSNEKLRVARIIGGLVLYELVLQLYELFVPRWVRVNGVLLSLLANTARNNSQSSFRRNMFTNGPRTIFLAVVTVSRDSCEKIDLFAKRLRAMFTSYFAVNIV